ncbi:MAG: aldo/keto reductase [Boseongicola sp.]|nr:aldo/keto reductase [Boseongicola sp.]
MPVTQTRLLNDRTSRPVELSVLGFGGAPIGNLYREVSDDDAGAALSAAFDAGVRYFDTAPLYGLGLSELRFSRAIREFGRDNLVLSTKVGRRLLDCGPDEVTPEAYVKVSRKRIVFDYSYDGVMRSYDDSKARLDIACADILFVHDVCAFSQGSQDASDRRVRELLDKGGYRALGELRDAGEISAIGAGVNEWQVCERLLGLADFDCFLLAGRYTLLEQDALETFLPLCQRRDVGIILGGPFNSGILATGAVPSARYNYAAAPPEILGRVSRMNEVCKAHGTRLIAAALQFVLGHPCVKSVIPGASSAAEVRSIVSCLAEPIPDALWLDMRQRGLIRSDAPVPASGQDSVQT